MNFGNAKWIWVKDEPTKNQYASFNTDFDFNGEQTVLKLSAETDYIVYLNGKAVFNCQFAGYKSEKYYDEDDITEYCKVGSNTLLITVRYEGYTNSFVHIEDGAGLIFSLEQDGKQIAYSSEDTMGALSQNYVHGVDRLITEQLGYTVTMTNRGKNEEFSPCRIVSNISYNLKKRPVKRTELLAPVSGKALDVEGRRIFDLGREDCGYIYLNVKCNKPTDVKVAYGEHLVDGCVRYLIGHRDFSFDFQCSKGENSFVQYFVRMAGRYLEVFADNDVEIVDVGIIPTIYPLTVKPHSLTGLEKQIYDVSVRTLRLCMHTHYEDCPWREQSMYVVDSRNQMLCGYYAFEETEFQRESLIFMSKGKMADGMFELTFPAVNTPSIPFFTVMYAVAVNEYVEHTGDETIIPEVLPAIKEYMDCVYSWKDGTGLIANQKKPYWNFYEWSYGNEGRKGFGEENTHDLIMSCAFIRAYESMKKLYERMGEEAPVYDTEDLKAAIVKNLFDNDRGIFLNTLEKDVYTVLGNAFALSVGLGDERTLKAIRDGVDGVELTPATLSMLAYVYDVIIERCSDGKEFVLNDIYKNYSYMLSKDATSFWETIKGDSDFHNAGSLCHGWSAMPVYYFRKFFPEKFN